MSLKVRTKTFYRLQHFNRTLLLSTLYDILINGYDWRLGPTEEILIGDVEWKNNAFIEISRCRHTRDVNANVDFS